MTNKKGTIEPASVDVESYDIFTCNADPRKDLHVYFEYVGDRFVKRSFRENKIPRTDAKRLAKILSDPKASDEIDEKGESEWLNFVDGLALDLGFVKYNTAGQYSRSSASFPENRIYALREAYESFLSLPLQKQEEKLFQAMIGKYSEENNEFFRKSLFGRLDAFSSRGYATGVVPLVKFNEVRKFLFERLKSLTPGVWYETASLVRFFEKENPYFLIPKNPKFKYHYESKDNRYCNFQEQDDKGSDFMRISDKDRDGFSRVEGRYVERFLENIPLTLGYVDVAYGPQDNPGERPSRGSLKAFRTTEAFSLFMSGKIPESRVTVHPNHEIHVESQWYPASAVDKLKAFSDPVSAGKIHIRKLNKSKVVRYLAENDSVDPKKYLGRLSENPLPSNIAAELDEWAGHSETFVLYKGFGLLEGKGNSPLAKEFEVEALSPDLKLVRSPDELFSELEAEGQVPVLVAHLANALISPHKDLNSVFARKLEKAKKTEEKKPIYFVRKTVETLYFKNGWEFDVFVKALVEEKCPAAIDKNRRTVAYSSGQRKQVDEAVKKLKKTYQVKIEEQ